jgi:hypothetical protein
MLQVTTIETGNPIVPESIETARKTTVATIENATDYYYSKCGNIVHAYINYRFKYYRIFTFSVVLTCSVFYSSYTVVCTHVAIDFLGLL